MSRGLMEGKGARDYAQRSRKSETTRLIMGFIRDNVRFERKSLVADLGADSGNFEELFCKYVKRIDAVELSEEMTKIMKARFKKENVNVIKADIADTKLDSGAYDIALLLMVLHHTEKPEPVLEEAFRILKKGGTPVCVDMLTKHKILARIYDHFYSLKRRSLRLGHTYRSESETRSILEKHFAIIKRSELPYTGIRGKVFTKIAYCLKK